MFASTPHSAHSEVYPPRPGEALPLLHVCDLKICIKNPCQNNMERKRQRVSELAPGVVAGRTGYL